MTHKKISQAWVSLMVFTSQMPPKDTVLPPFLRETGVNVMNSRIWELAVQSTREETPEKKVFSQKKILRLREDM
jgi:hypothetical protein